MWLRKFLGLPDEADSPTDSDTLRKITRALDQLPTERARQIASFAYLLGRVAHADLDISDVETRAMERIVCEKMHLPEEQAILAVQIAKTQARLHGGTEDYLVARELGRIASREDKIALLHCLFAVCAADETITTVEDNEISKIASELRLDRDTFLEVRRSYRDHLAVLKS